MPSHTCPLLDCSDGTRCELQQQTLPAFSVHTGDKDGLDDLACEEPNGNRYVLLSGRACSAAGSESGYPYAPRTHCPDLWPCTVPREDLGNGPVCLWAVFLFGLTILPCTLAPALLVAPVTEGHQPTPLCALAPTAAWNQRGCITRTGISCGDDNTTDA